MALIEEKFTNENKSARADKRTNGTMNETKETATKGNMKHYSTNLK